MVPLPCLVAECNWPTVYVENFTVSRTQERMWRVPGAEDSEHMNDAISSHSLWKTWGRSAALKGANARRTGLWQLFCSTLNAHNPFSLPSAWKIIQPRWLNKTAMPGGSEPLNARCLGRECSIREGLLPSFCLLSSLGVAHWPLLATGYRAFMGLWSDLAGLCLWIPIWAPELSSFTLIICLPFTLSPGAKSLWSPVRVLAKPANIWATGEYPKYARADLTDQLTGPGLR